MSTIVGIFIFIALLALPFTPGCQQIQAEMRAQAKYESEPHLYKSVGGMKIYRFRDGDGHWVYINDKGGANWEITVRHGKHTRTEMRSSIGN
jgi:hypothetical protein